MSGIEETELLRKSFFDVFIYDQQCVYGERYLDGHAVYCHCENEKSPYKCHFAWFWGDGTKDSDCEFFKLNPNWRDNE